MLFQTIAPPDILKPFIKYFWVLKSNAVEATPKTFGAIVDGCPGVIMLQSDQDSFCDEDQKKLPNIFLYGQTVRPVRFSAAGNTDVLGVCFQPHALKSVFGLDAQELTSACLDLNLLSHKKQGKLSDQLLNTPAAGDKIELLSAYFIERIKHNTRKQDDVIRHAVHQIMQSGGAISLKEIQVSLKISERSLERKFQQTIGVSPKLFSRICRFQESLNQMRQSNYDKLSDLAYENNYADQSHFIKVFKEFTGFSPLDFKKKANEVVENFPQIDPQS